MVETPHFHCKGAQVQSLVGEPGSHMPQCVAKKKKKKNQSYGKSKYASLLQISLSDPTERNLKKS